MPYALEVPPSPRTGLERGPTALLPVTLRPPGKPCVSVAHFSICAAHSGSPWTQGPPCTWSVDIVTKTKILLTCILVSHVSHEFHFAWHKLGVNSAQQVPFLCLQFVNIWAGEALHTQQTPDQIFSCCNWTIQMFLQSGKERVWSGKWFSALKNSS